MLLKRIFSNNRRGKKMSKIFSIKINEDDLARIEEAKEKDKRTRNNFMVIAGIERAERILGGN